MKKLSVEFKVLALVFVIAIFGIISSAFILDKYYMNDNDNAMEVQSNVDVTVNVYNNSDKVDVDVIKKDDGAIDVVVNDKKPKKDDKKNESKEKTDQEINETSSSPLKGIVNSEDGLNIRKHANIKSDKVGVYEYGTNVEITGIIGDWYSTDRGFIYKEYVLLL